MELILFFIKSYLAVWIGLFIHTAKKYNETKTLYEKSNEAFTFTQYLSVDRMGHLINVACCVLWMLVFRDLVREHPEVKTYYWILGSAAVGFLNSMLWLSLFSATRKRILRIIDDKTNIADGK